MSESVTSESEISRDHLAELLKEDRSREYRAIIAYVVYSQVLSGAEYMDLAAQLEIHAKQELDHALILSRQIDYLGKMPAVTPKPVRTSKSPEDMLRYDLDNENETIRNYRDRVRQCEILGEYAMAEQIRQILVQEQDHQIDLGHCARHRSSRRWRWSQSTHLAQASLTLLATPSSEESPLAAAVARMSA
jgi:bacterioferritin